MSHSYNLRINIRPSERARTLRYFKPNRYVDQQAIWYGMGDELWFMYRQMRKARCERQEYAVAARAFAIHPLVKQGYDKITLSFGGFWGKRSHEPNTWVLWRRNGSGDDDMILTAADFVGHYNRVTRVLSR